MPRFAVVPLRKAILLTRQSKRQRVVEEYTGYIEQLGTGQAGKLTPGEGETSLAVRRRLTDAAKASGKRVKVTRMGNEVYFWLDTGGVPVGRHMGRRARSLDQVTSGRAAYQPGVEDGESIEGVRRGLEQMARGKGRPAKEVFAEFRARHGIMNG